MATHTIVQNKFRASLSFDTAFALDTEAASHAYTESYDFTMPTPGMYAANSEAEFDAITWNDMLPKPLWADVQSSFATWLLDLYGYQQAYMLDINDAYNAVDKLYDHWHGTTQYTGSQLRQYTNTAETDSDGRVAFNLTDDGTGGGTALFSSVFSANASGVDSSGVPAQGIFLILESVSGNTYTFRAICDDQYAGSGYTVYVHVIGAK